VKHTLLLLAVLIIVPAFAHGQSACAQLGVDCSHPTVEQRPTPQNRCGPQCQADQDRENREYWEKKRAYDKRHQELKQGNKLAREAWKFKRNGDCTKAVELYSQALAVTDDDFFDWKEKRAECMQALHNDNAAYTEFEQMINNPQTPDSEIPHIRNMEWGIMDEKGYTCPLPPFFNGTIGCHRKSDHTVKTLDGIYVPLPYIEGKSWSPLAIQSSGPYVVTTKDGRTTNCGDSNPTCTSLNMLDAHIETGQHSVVHFLLPDETVFTLGPNSDMTLDNYVYDPNTNTSTMNAKLINGVFRFVTGKFFHSEVPENDPQSKIVKFLTLPPGAYQGSTPAMGSLGLRGTDVEVRANTFGQYETVLWICAYEGDISYTDKDGAKHPVPVGYTLLIDPHGTPDKSPIAFADLGYDFAKRLLGWTDEWDDDLMNHIKTDTGR
jgi:hypothetical protein